MMPSKEMGDWTVKDRMKRMRAEQSSLIETIYNYIDALPASLVGANVRKHLDAPKSVNNTLKAVEFFLFELNQMYGVDLDEK